MQRVLINYLCLKVFTEDNIEKDSIFHNCIVMRKRKNITIRNVRGILAYGTMALGKLKSF